ncbi:hypothetical protein HY492_00940 [Candidatus Woesearchaeota archaeon]|nr:hypothetical protein [Candidatus Woesearchaeota archaeon]
MPKEEKKDEKKELSPSEYFEQQANDEKRGAWDKIEIAPNQIIEYKDSYPKPLNRMRLIVEHPNLGIEPLYFWCLTHYRAQGFPIVDKVNDVFSASESSSMFGQGQQRLGLTQDRVFTFLRTIHEMVNSLPQYVRELRAIAERRSYYVDSDKQGGEGEAAEKTLKGLYVDLVEGGTKNPASVFGLSQQVGFVVLPNLFFSMRREPGESDDSFWERVKKLGDGKDGFNPSVLDVLQRKLKQYYTWKKATHEELTKRRTYLLKYLKQYYATIKLYMKWVKPYLKAAKRMGLDIDRMSRAELTKSFETALIEIEVLGKKLEAGSGDKDSVFNCLMMTFQYRTKPAMSFVTPDYQHRGPTHTGEAELTWRSYTWTQKDIDMFKKLKDQEDYDLLKDINETLKESLSEVEEDLSTFLEQADQEVFGAKEDKKPEDAKTTWFQPATDVFSGINGAVKDVFGGGKEIVSAFWPSLKKSPEAGVISRKQAIARSTKKTAWRFYKIFKIAHKFATWS